MSNYTDTLQHGDKIGCYRIKEVLGRGGFAVTYLATDENLDVEVAVKEYLPREITQRDDNLQVSPRKQEFAEDYNVGLDNFAREAKTLARFKHPHIVRVHQVLHENNTAYMVMDFEKGQELAEILESHNTLPEEELRNILFPIMDGVEEIHRHGFVHRDIKPSNIYVRHNGSPVLIDFGAARYTMSETTQQLTAVVTVGYTPIEQYNVSEDSQGPWSDIYALAAVCYEAVTGEVPADSVTRASASVTKGDDPLPSVRNNAKQRYSDDCLDAIDWGLRMDAEDRPQVIAQWRDSFDGIFNPASAYIAKKDVSIYSPHRVDTPVHQQARNSEHDVVSIPLNETERPMGDTELVSLSSDPDGDSVVSRMPPVPQQATEKPRDVTSDTQTFHESNSEHTQQRNVLRRDTGQPEQDTRNLRSVDTSQPQLEQPPARTKSRFERPTEEPGAPREARRRGLPPVREDIEFDETDWDYEPPKRPSAWRLVFPAIGLAAVVGVSILYVNFPEMINNLGNRNTGIKTEDALDMAQEKMNASAYIFPAGDSAIDYYNQVLASDPDNIVARAGVSELEKEVREKIASNMQGNNLSEANRLLARADKVGLTGIYGSQPEAQQQEISDNAPTVTEPSNTTTEPSGAVVTAIDTAPIQPQQPSPTTTQTQDTTTVEDIVAAVSTDPNTGIDNKISPYIQSQIEEIESLVDQKKFAEAQKLFTETDKFIPDSATSRRLQFMIDSGQTANNNSNPQPQVIEQPQATPPAQAPQPQSSQPQAPQTQVPQTQEVTPTAPVVVEPPAPVPSGGRVVASGAIATHLSQLREAMESKSMASVVAISEPFPAARTQFLNRMFKVYDRIDVTIDNVDNSGDSLTAKLNVSMFNRGDDGSFYSAGKWSGVTLNSTRQNGEWQKIRW